MDVKDYSAVELSRIQKQNLTPKMASWRTVYDQTHLLEDSSHNLKQLGLMLAWEIKNPDGPRSQILTRLHMRINAMRQRLEFNAVIKHAAR
jgi:hypothetical protein